MKNFKYERALKWAGENAKRFKRPANYMVSRHIIPVAGAPAFTDADLDVFVTTYALDFATGSRLSRNRYLVIGFVVGVGATVLVMKWRANNEHK